MTRLSTVFAILIASLALADEFGDVVYPVELTAKQKSALAALASLSWQIPPDPGETKEWQTRRLRQWEELLASLPKLGLPGLAKCEEIQVTKEKIANTSGNDLLVVIAHETGRDIAHRTHWIEAGQSIPNRSIYGNGMMRCRILWPRPKGE